MIKSKINRDGMDKLEKAAQQGAEDAIKHMIRKARAEMDAQNKAQCTDQRGCPCAACIILYGDPDADPSLWQGLMGKSPIQSAREKHARENAMPKFGEGGTFDPPPRPFFDIDPLGPMAEVDVTYIDKRDSRTGEDTVRYRLDDLSEADLDEINRMLNISEVVKVEREIGATGKYITVTYRAGVKPITPSEVRGECRQRSGNIFTETAKAAGNCSISMDEMRAAFVTMTGKTNASERFRTARANGFADGGEVKFHHGARRHGKTQQQREQQHVFETDFITADQMRDYAKRPLKAELKFDADFVRDKLKDCESPVTYLLQVRGKLREQSLSRVPVSQLMKINGMTYHVLNAKFTEV